MEASPAPAVRRAMEPPLRVEALPARRSRAHFVGYAANVSETGIFVQCSKPRPVGQRIKLVLHLPSAAGGGLLELDADIELEAEPMNLCLENQPRQIEVQAGIERMIARRFELVQRGDHRSSLGDDGSRLVETRIGELV